MYYSSTIITILFLLGGEGGGRMGGMGVVYGLFRSLYPGRRFVLVPVRYTGGMGWDGI